MTSNRKYQYTYNQYAKIYFLVVVIATILLCSIYNFGENQSNFIKKEQIHLVNQDLMYFLNTSTCKIPENDPFSEEIISFIEEKKYFKCSSKELLSYITKKDGIVTLHVNRSLFKEYSIFDITCCYSNITRINYEHLPDNEIKLTDCIYFEDSVELRYPYIKVVCSTIFKEVYANVHATTISVPKEKLTPLTDSKFSILLLGIDSISKSNLKRTMRKTYDYVEKTMINLRGYNKIGDNTFPNLMAMLTGYSRDQLDVFCNNSIKLNHCKFVWDTFKGAGYTTAYAEDECVISTYHYNRPGFAAEPTDFYYHPYFIAAEQLPVIERSSMTFCAGPETSGERILNSAKDFSVTFNNTPYFGLFWSNSYSHDDINMPAVMDTPVYTLLSDPEFLDSLNHTILFFYSDHGFRFGKFRYTYAGWLEERLPFMYIRVPDSFKKAYPEKYNNFLINSERLTTPWDVFYTFQDVLKMQNESYSIVPSQGCTICQSLFTEIAENRTCADANITQHWCTCNSHSYVNPDNPKVVTISRFIVSEVNRLLDSHQDGDLCLKYTVKRIKSAGVSESADNIKRFLLMIETEPTAVFEATVEEIDNYNFKLSGEVSRVDRYGPVSKCIENNGVLKKYCYCNSILARINNIFW